MHKLLSAALLLIAGAASAQDYDMCFDTAATQMLPVPDGIIGAEACEAACQADESCIAWNYRPHSFEPETMAGDCRLMPDVFMTDASDSYFCGRIER